jgi:hypothetical protein
VLWKCTLYSVCSMYGSVANFSGHGSVGERVRYQISNDCLFKEDHELHSCVDVRCTINCRETVFSVGSDPRLYNAELQVNRQS